MGLYQESTKTRPLLFFESFLKNDKLIKYESMFYEYPINLSQENFREQGYIKYLNDSYIDEPVSTIEYFNETLNKLLKAQVFTSKMLLEERKDEIEYFNIKPNIFAQKQLEIIKKLKVKTGSITVCRGIILESLNILEEEIIKFNSIISQEPSRFTNIKTNNPFFEPVVNRKILQKLYDVALDNRIIDEEVVTENAFLNILTSNDPEVLENKFIFSCNNQVATFFLNTINVFFLNLTHSKISKSKSFINKNGKIFNESDLNTAKTRYSEKTTNKVFLNIQKDIEKFMKK